MPNQLTITKKFGERIKLLRKERGFSQEALAELCDLDRTYISSIERGLRNVALKNIETLAKALNVSLSKLFEDL
jgi:transcriptional regulator with XRE-family HTH domain